MYCYNYSALEIVDAVSAPTRHSKRGRAVAFLNREGSPRLGYASIANFSLAVSLRPSQTRRITCRNRLARAILKARVHRFAAYRRMWRSMCGACGGAVTTSWRQKQPGRIRRMGSRDSSS